MAVNALRVVCLKLVACCIQADIIIAPPWRRYTSGLFEGKRPAIYAGLASKPRASSHGINPRVRPGMRTGGSNGTPLFSWEAGEGKGCSRHASRPCSRITIGRGDHDQSVQPAQKGCTGDGLAKHLTSPSYLLGRESGWVGGGGGQG